MKNLPSPSGSVWVSMVGVGLEPSSGLRVRKKRKETTIIEVNTIYSPELLNGWDLHMARPRAQKKKDRERERQRDRERQREKDSERQRHRERGRDRQREQERLEKSAAPGLTLLESQVKCLLFAHDLVLLSPPKEGLQQHLDLMHRFYQTWALTVNLSKAKIVVFQKRSSCQDHKYKFHLDTVALEHTKKTIHTSS